MTVGGGAAACGGAAAGAQAVMAMDIASSSKLLMRLPTHTGRAL
jgi:predicted RNA methylase